MVLHCSIYPSIVWLPFHSESERYLNFNERNEGQRTMSVHRDLFKFPLRFHFMCFFLRFPFVNIIGHNVFTPKPSVCKGLTYFHTYLQCVFVFLAPFYLHYADGLFLWYFVDNFQHLKCYLTSGSGSGMKRRNVEGVGEVDEEPKWVCGQSGGEWEKESGVTATMHSTVNFHAIFGITF